MKKRVKGRKFARESASRRALFRGLVRALVMSGKVNTTLAKAKATQPIVEKLMTQVGKGGLPEKRRVLGVLANDKKTTDTFFKKYQKLTEKRKSGFTRIIKLGVRKGDGAQTARLEWVDTLTEEKKSVKKSEKAKKSTKKKPDSKRQEKTKK